VSVFRGFVRTGLEVSVSIGLRNNFGALLDIDRKHVKGARVALDRDHGVASRSVRCSNSDNCSGREQNALALSGCRFNNQDRISETE